MLICDNCFTKACADGYLFCEDYRTAGFLEVTEKQYAKMSKTNPYLQGAQDKSKSLEKKDE